MSRARRVPARFKSAVWCPACGASVAPLSRGELRVLAAIALLDAESAATPLLGRGARGPAVAERSGLDHTTITEALILLRGLGYIATKKGYRRRYNVHRLSPATQADPYLMEQITQEMATLAAPRTRLTRGALATLAAQKESQ